MSLEYLPYLELSIFSFLPFFVSPLPAAPTHVCLNLPHISAHNILLWHSYILSFLVFPLPTPLPFFLPQTLFRPISALTSPPFFPGFLLPSAINCIQDYPFTLFWSYHFNVDIFIRVTFYVFILISSIVLLFIYVKHLRFYFYRLDAMHILVLLYYYNLKDGHVWLPLNPFLSEKHNS